MARHSEIDPTLLLRKGDRAGRRDGRDDRDAAGGQRRELLRGAAQLHGRHEEPGGQVQRSQVRREVGTR